MIYSSSDIECDRLKLVIMSLYYVIFCPFTHPQPLKTKKMIILKIQKRLLEISSFCICVPNTTIIRGTVPETWSETKFFAILGHFLPFYLSNIPENHNLKQWKKVSEDVIISHVYQKSQSYDVCFMRYSVTDIIFCHSGLFSALFPH